MSYCDVDAQGGMEAGTTRRGAETPTYAITWAQPTRRLASFVSSSPEDRRTCSECLHALHHAISSNAAAPKTEVYSPLQGANQGFRIAGNRFCSLYPVLPADTSYVGRRALFKVHPATPAPSHLNTAVSSSIFRSGPWQKAAKPAHSAAD